MAADKSLKSHLDLLSRRPDVEDLSEICTTPIFTASVCNKAVELHKKGGKGDAPFPQYGLIAGHTEGNHADPRLFYNTSAPSSVFICGSQGSGKSHTLSCLLENCLMTSKAAQLPHPLTGLVFHYDTFISENNGQRCEAAFLASNPGINVRVLCPPTNVRAIKAMYHKISSRIKVEELRIKESDLNTKRMLDLMAVSGSESMPLYMHVINRILRDMRLLQQQSGDPFNYGHFLRMIDQEDLTPPQKNPLKQRLDTLESFMVNEQSVPGAAPIAEKNGAKKKKKFKKVWAPTSKGTTWTPKRCQLTIVDLSCPCVTPEMACSLFNICLSLFLEQEESKIGRVIALDEAHKYMGTSSEARTLTENLLSAVRLQRHVAARIIVATQEPTISPALLDLCSVTIVHRFSSPNWLNVLKKHIAGVSMSSRLIKKTTEFADGAATSSSSTSRSSSVFGASPNLAGSEDSESSDGFAPATNTMELLSLKEDDPATDLFARIVSLRVGEALMFAPSAILGVEEPKEQGKPLVVERLDHGVLKVRIRARITQDGGKSVMAA